jgi:hypothetical protein
VKILRSIDQTGWSYWIRIHAKTYGRRESRQAPVMRGQKLQFWTPSREPVLVGDLHDEGSRLRAGGTGLLLGRERGSDPAPATNRKLDFSSVCIYQKRMWIEELFGGWLHLHQTGLYAPVRPSRLVLSLSLVCVWLVFVPGYVVGRGWRRRVDRTDRYDRRDLAIGLRWIRRRVPHQSSLPLRMAPTSKYF